MILTHEAQRDGKLLTFLRRELALSSSLVKRLKWQNAFSVNGEVVHTDYYVNQNDVITVILDEAEPEFPPEDGPLEILYEDEALLAVDKPAGILMHPSFYRDTGTLANRIAAYYVNSNQPCAVHPVSRLDRDTFGVVLLAKNAHIHAKMMELLQTRQVQKSYEALVFNAPEANHGTWRFPIAKRGGGSLLREVRADGQAAETQFELISNYVNCSHLRLHPVTGRTHQLRVHCAHIGCPILGDPQYGTEASLALSAQFCLPHQQLCAVSLSFPHPMTGDTIELHSSQQVFLPK